MNVLFNHIDLVRILLFVSVLIIASGEMEYEVTVDNEEEFVVYINNYINARKKTVGFLLSRSKI